MSNNSAISGRVRLYRASAKGSIVCQLFLAGMLIGATPTFAKERDPEPLENPGDCPVDAPIRVASMDSLRHFEGLVGHCPETTLIESPAFKANRPRGDMRHPDAVREPANGTDVPQLPQTNRVIVASLSSDKKSLPKPANQSRNSTSQIAIVPSADAFRPLNRVPVSPNAGKGSEVEAILALRPQSYSTKFDEKIADAARAHQVDPLLLHAVIKQESGYRQRAVSHAGARGLMQVMPATGRGLGVKNPQHLFDPKVNIDAGAKLLSQLWARFDGNIDLVLAAYNAGEGAVRKHGMRVPPYRETRDYVVKVKANYQRLAGESGIAVHF